MLTKDKEGASSSFHFFLPEQLVVLMPALRRLGGRRADPMDSRAEYTKLSFRSIYLYAAPLAALLSAAQIYSGHWILSNVVALAFAYNAISLLYLDSFGTGSILLGGLFFYDIWCVPALPSTASWFSHRLELS